MELQPRSPRSPRSCTQHRCQLCWRPRQGRGGGLFGWDGMDGWLVDVGRMVLGKLFSDLIATSLGMVVSMGDYPQMILIQVSELS